MDFNGPEPQRLIRWVEDYWPGTVHNLSASGLPEPVLSDLGIDTSIENMKSEVPDTKAFFREELCRLYGFEPENVYLTTGGSESIGLMGLVAKYANIPVFVGLPEYEPIFNAPRNLGVDTITAPFEKLDGIMEKHHGPKALFFSNPNNPLGRRHSRDFLQSIRERHFGKGGFMYADEAFLEFTMKESPETFYEDSEEIVVNGSMTKFYGFSNFRVGWIAGPSKIVGKLRDIRNVTGIRNPEYPLWLAGQFLQKREWFMRRARRILEPNLAYLRKFVSEHEQLGWTEPTEGSYALISYKWKIGSEKFCKGAYEKEKVLIGPGEYFGSDGAFRLCFTEEPDKFRGSMEALDRYLSSID